VDLDRAQRASGTVRALEPRDLPALVALRRAAFKHSERSSDTELASFLRAVFFDGPWQDPELPSLVYEDEAGHVGGFIGILPRRMLVDGMPIRAAVATQLMVAAGAHSLAARRLTRAFIEGPHDLCLGDCANDPARRLWTSFGGHTSTLLSMNWLRRLRPFRHAMQRLGPSRLAGAARALTAPVTGLLDARSKGFVAESNLLRTYAEPLTAKAVCDDQDDVLSGFTLRPWYDARSLEWLLARAAEKRQFGPLFSKRIRNVRGDPLGWYVYYLGSSGVANVLQIAARRRHEPVVLQHLFRDAWNRGAHAVSGRTEPWLMETLLSTDSVYVYQGPWTLLHSRRRELTDMIDRGAGYLSRLDGEWWLSF
jgi:hypothetical protein